MTSQVQADVLEIDTLYPAEALRLADLATQDVKRGPADLAIGILEGLEDGDAGSGRR